MRISDWSSDVCSSDLDGLAARFAGRRIVAVTSHRRENFGGGMEAIARSIADIAERPDVAVIFPVHPNPHVRPVMDAVLADLRSEERSVGKEGVSTCRSRWSPDT